MKKIAFLTGFVAGYVLGARAGHQRYEQLKSRAEGVWHNPKVQETVTQAQGFAAQKAPEVQHKLAETASHAAHRVTDKIGSDGGRTSSSDDSRSAETSPGTTD